MDGLDRVYSEDAVLILHEFGEEIHDFHQPRLSLIIDHEVVARLVVRSHANYVAVLQQEELIPMQLHKL